MNAKITSLAAIMFLAVAPHCCFADWGVVELSEERARELGVMVRAQDTGRTELHFTVEFKSGDDVKNIGRVDLQLGADDSPTLTAPLHVDRSKPERGIVSFTADRAQVDKLTLRLWVRDELLGGTIYLLRLKEFSSPAESG
jgi:hypothetical protein